ncbi:protein-glutamate methylesterase/protein-glutamine glutaminase [Thermospira aquatica]|uniref:Protein-glutamate methylesterase/protein-glutamine glutaminase n=1 Tax=Thermospira aquatica TaxID=2828656 RepID=A0AAX3BFX4_9SPIR|nr:chemotaxis response regulator protein-glutamate methylesterase [Thermospira aquatica]URA10366.1 chemotaxis response regulator protein-glutamate methylesterase [Thermospira aquatica]
MSKIRVFIVDDSPIVQEILQKGLSQDPDIEVVGVASDPYEASEKLSSIDVDVMTLDLEMPRMNGIIFLKQLLPQYPLPVIVVTSLTDRGGALAWAALQAGAVEVVPKPKAEGQEALVSFLQELISKIKWASQIKFPQAKKTIESHPTVSDASEQIIAIGASLGGTSAISTLFRQFPATMPPILIVQHMPPTFSRMFAESLQKETVIKVKEASDGDKLEIGHAYIALGDFHMELKPDGTLAVTRGERVSGHIPSVDVLFMSVAKHAGPRSIGVLLTGMGKDGAQGLLLMKQHGARTIAQDESTSVVFGMPYEAYKIGAVDMLLPLHNIPQMIIKLVKEYNQRKIS